MRRKKFFAITMMLAVLGVFLTFNSASASWTCCSVEKEANGGSSSGGAWNVDYYVCAQSFTPQESYTLCKVKVMLSDNGSAGDATITLYIQNDDSNSPGTIYTQASLSSLGKVWDFWYSFDVPDITLNAGTTYYIRVASTIHTPPTSILWHHEGYNSYPNGQAYLDGAPRNDDFKFITYTYGDCPEVKWSQPPVPYPNEPPTEIVKWEQIWDSEPSTGVDVNVTKPSILADDFLCDVTGKVTGITIWGSWLNDYLPFDDAGNVQFTLSFHSDNPQGPMEWSGPNEVLWTRTFRPGEFYYWCENESYPIPEGWLDPPMNYIFPADNFCWAYFFPMDPNDPYVFHQEGNSVGPVVYWLDVQADPCDSQAAFGWKTSLDHWNDDAVWGQGSEPFYGPWNELRYPSGHQFGGESIDLAFSIYTVPDSPDTNDLYVGWDEKADDWPQHPNDVQMVADDFLCDSSAPVTAIRWWGSFLGWYDNAPPPASELPIGFYLTIWTNVPDVEPDDPAFYSYPNYIIWDNFCDSYTVEYYGKEYDPRKGIVDLPKFEFYQQIDPCDYWYQPDDQQIYWLGISAVYGDRPNDPCYPWGWETREHFFMDDAVRLFSWPNPSQTYRMIDFEPIKYDDETWDLSFELITREPCEPNYTPKPAVPHLKWSQPPIEIDPNSLVPIYCGWDEPSFREWIEPEYFPCWDCPTQCYGDADCDTDVDADDLLIMTAADGSMYGDPDYDHCADINRDFYVNHEDQDIIFNWLGTFPPSDCPEEGDVPDPQSWWVVADDFRCLGTMPVTSIHWWGSYLAWEGAEPPEPEPIAWRIGFWSNIRDPDPCDPLTFSYPRHLLWQIEVPANRVDINNVGQDYAPYMPFSDTCFQYYVDLEPDEYFWQSEFEPNTMDSVFWLSIAAIYPPGVYTDFLWGWKTRPWHWMDDAVHFQLDKDPYPGMPPLNPEFNYIAPIEIEGESYDVTFELDTDPDYIKWEQAYEGIRRWPHYEDVESVAFEYEYGELKYGQEPDLAPTGMDVLAGPSVDPCSMELYEKFLADDFLCTASGPITDILLYASYNQDMRYDEMPWFSLVIYENVPADACVPYSRPGEVLWEAYLEPTDQWVCTEAPELFYDPNPDTIIGEDTQVWNFYFRIDPDEAFVQEEGKIYWLGVHHSFDFDGDGMVTASDALTMIEYWPAGLFGWKTSLDHFEDDAVWTDVYTFGDGPHVVPSGEVWKELRYPFGHPYEGSSIDLAFELGTEITDTDIYSLVADDWRCERRTPVTAVVWWGSYVGYQYEACQQEYPEQPMSLPVKPTYFLLNIWTDVPASGDCNDPNSCCCPHPWPGCDDPCCEASVCSYDPYCCENNWDGVCADEARTDPNCSECYGLPQFNPYSHPGRKVWEYKAYDYDEVLVGYDKHPEYRPPYRTEPVFRYSVRLPEENWFCQPDVNSIYWLSIVAVYAEEYPEVFWWGWTNHEHVFNDDAVIGWLDYEDPDEWEWEELYDQTGASEDMSFVLFTDPNECVDCADYNTDFIVNFVDYADFADDWRWTGPAGGYNNSDLNCNGAVDFYDLRIFALQWLQSCPCCSP